MASIYITVKIDFQFTPVVEVFSTDHIVVVGTSLAAFPAIGTSLAVSTSAAARTLVVADRPVEFPWRRVGV